jgi:propionyl-CoA synthetase
VSAQQLNKTSIEDPNEFWGAAARKIDWIKAPATTLNTQVPHGRWFEGGKLNTAYNCLDRHIKAGRGGHLALVHDSAVTSTITKYTYDELLEQTVQLASVLRKLGVEKGDRVVIYMPNIPEAAISMLACARIGAIHSVVFGGFADAELATRIKDSTPKVILASSCGIENSKVLDYKKLLDSALNIASAEHEVQNCLIFQRDAYQAPLVNGRDIDMRKAMKEEASVASADRAHYEVMDSSDPLYILYTSGTTGKPKGVVRDNGGHAVALRWSMEGIYNMKQNDVFWAAR